MKNKVLRYNRIKAILGDLGITNKMIAEHFEIEKETVSRWVSNKSQPSLKRLYEIAEFLDIDVRELIVSNKEKK